MTKRRSATAPPTTTPNAGTPIPPAGRWPAAEVVFFPLASIVPNPGNPRVHRPEQVGQLARSICEWGFTVPLLVDESRNLIAGHGRLAAAELLGLEQVPCMVAVGWTAEQRRAYTIADNQLAAVSTWDRALLGADLGALDVLGADLSLLGFDDSTLDSLLPPIEAEPERIDAAADDAPEPRAFAVSRPGDVWELGDHRVVCGDSTDPATFAALFGPAPELATFVLADPPYGMSKGIANDDLRRHELDAFQMRWVAAVLPRCRENCSLLLWGNAPDLFRLWFAEGGLSTFDPHGLSLASFITWDKGSPAGGQLAPGQNCFPAGQMENALFVQRGPQHLGSLNAEDYFEGNEPVRLWLCAQRELAGWTNADVHRITGTVMAGHWFTRSQFYPPTREHYEAMRAAAAPTGSAFLLTWDEFVAKFADVFAAATEYRAGKLRELQAARSWFDNTHAAMSEVWAFPRVKGAERHGHPTPKPVAMLALAIRSACPEGAAVLDPFLGSGSSLIAAHPAGRRCFGVELDPVYVDVAVRRWQEQTGRAAVLAGTRATFAEVEAAPRPE